ncbi:hypothetical protein FHL15_010956 [Xylaria flabelliformis]|uniref:Phosphatidate phosphatase APP1 catalytic domain-containing protein n=1 Tax=Xylaria flabelliformis TaxID=2512241 RepID=A0A553HJN8_9PEZI|nr:hypothetical protein FHL15_010956 [Xylaria flabelliformis]
MMVELEAASTEGRVLSPSSLGIAFNTFWRQYLHAKTPPHSSVSKFQSIENAKIEFRAVPISLPLYRLTQEKVVHPASLTTLAPPRRFLERWASSRQRLSLVRYLFPQSLRSRYREGLISFRLDTLPYYKHRLQGRVYRYIVEHQRRRQERSRLVDHAWRLLLGQPAARRVKHGTATPSREMTSLPGLGVGSGNYGADSGRERGTRRRKLAAMAGSVYRAGAVAVNEIKESYNQTRSTEDDPEIAKITIPGSFPDVAIVTKGNEQMVLFPSYAKRHVKQKPRQFAHPGGPPPPSSVGMVNEQEYWRQEWARYEDETAVVDVDVRGWIYNPHRGPMTRRNRVLIGLARQLSGIPVPRVQPADNALNSGSSSTGVHQQHEDERERQSIAREAQEIERRGRAEEEAAQQGDYSEKPKDESSEDEGDRRRHHSSRSPTPQARSFTPTLPTRSNTAGSSALSDVELAAANANLMARIGPFLTIPLVEAPITLFFYNDTQSQSRTVMTDDSGHFIVRAALDFVPTHVRVLANEDISCTEPVQVIEPHGISLISDIDDTIKRSNIALGAKEIFRNTFVRELKDLTISGVKEWYNGLHEMGVRIHYCSNSPWQLYPVLATYFKLAGLPPGSLHLKRYSGMLQGIFEPVAERKKGTLEKIMNDFPDRKFLLVGDSGEADLEVYTELAIANPGRIKGIFIRDVTTPERPGYFDAAYDIGEGRHVPRARQGRRDQTPKGSSENNPRSRPILPPRDATVSKSDGPAMDDLIDLSEEPTSLSRTETENTLSSLEQEWKQGGVQTKNLQGRKPPPPKPAKPSALQSTTSIPTISTKHTNPNDRKTAPAPPLPRRSFPGSEPSPITSSLHPLSQTHNSSDQTLKTPSNTSPSLSSISSEHLKSSSGTPPPPPPRRRGTPSNNITGGPSPRQMPSRRRTTEDDLNFDSDPPLISSSSMVIRSSTNSSGTSTPAPGGSPNNEGGPVNKKLELWRRRLERAQDTLSQHGIPLYTWRRGEDVVMEATGIVEEAMRDLRVRDRRP